MYIRTKDGVYEVDENSKGNEDFLWVKTNESNIVQLVWLNCILNQSENLEELCDRFVVMEKEAKEVRNIVSFLAYAKLWATCKYNIYGSIWCEWGLKYVAKMNDKGKLELI